MGDGSGVGVGFGAGAPRMGVGVGCGFGSADAWARPTAGRLGLSGRLGQRLQDQVTRPAITDRCPSARQRLASPGHAPTTRMPVKAAAPGLVTD